MFSSFQVRIHVLLTIMAKRQTLRVKKKGKAGEEKQQREKENTDNWKIDNGVRDRGKSSVLRHEYFHVDGITVERR